MATASTAAPVPQRIGKYMLLVDQARNWDYGSEHTHQEIEQILGHSYGSSGYKHSIAKAKPILLEAQKMLQPSRGVGYVVVMPDDYTEIASEYVRRGEKQFYKAAQIMKYAPVSLMSPTGKFTYNQFNQHLQNDRVVIEDTRVDLMMLAQSPAVVAMSHPIPPGH